MNDHTTITAPRTLVVKGLFTKSPLARLPARLSVLAGLFTIEAVAMSVWLNTNALTTQHGLAGLIGNWGTAAVRAAVAFPALFLTLAYWTARPAWQAVSSELAVVPVSLKLLYGHIATMIAFIALSLRLFEATGSSVPRDWLAATWLATGVLGVFLAVFALIPPRLCWEVLRVTGYASLYSLAAVSGAFLVVSYSGRLSEPLTKLTFRWVEILLRPFVSDLIVDAATATIGTPRFQAIILTGCSGIEGAGLMLMFGIAWLWFFRREYRFPQALLLLPVGVCTIWLLNGVRLAALILIGNAGAPAVAAGGFHSQAGWIAFNAVALGLSVATTRWSWLNRTAAGTRVVRTSSENSVSPYLMPILAILAAGMISRAVSSGFEWLYPLRFLAAAGVLFSFRARYRRMDWRFGWLSLVVGILVFALWIALDRIGGFRADPAIASGLASLSLSQKILWLAIRTLAFIGTVPIAEELAFRGFLIRRLISADFESIDMRKFSWLPVLAASLAFGLLHGDYWLAGTLAGLFYSGALLWRGRIGDAVVAHATTNALIAITVLFWGQWQLW